MEATPRGAWRSFVAALICLPAFLALRFFGWAQLGAPEDALLRPLAAEVIGYAAGWTAFAIASLPLARVWGREAQWPHFLSAWNWTNVVQYLVLLALTVPAAIGLPDWAAQGLIFAGLGYAIWLEWFTVRHALGVTPLRAAAMVGLDLAIGLFMSGFVARVSVG